MTNSQQFLGQLEVFLRDIVRDVLQDVLANKTTSTLQLTNRIGGIELAVEVTGMAKQTVYNMVSQRTLPHSKRGGRIFFEEEVLRNWMVDNRRPVQEAVCLKNVQSDAQLKKQRRRQGEV